MSSTFTFVTIGQHKGMISKGGRLTQSNTRRAWDLRQW